MEVTATPDRAEAREKAARSRREAKGRSGKKNRGGTCGGVLGIAEGVVHAEGPCLSDRPSVSIDCMREYDEIDIDHRFLWFGVRWVGVGNQVFVGGLSGGFGGGWGWGVWGVGGGDWGVRRRPRPATRIWLMNWYDGRSDHGPANSRVQDGLRRRYVRTMRRSRDSGVGSEALLCHDSFMGMMRI